MPADRLCNMMYHRLMASLECLYNGCVYDQPTQNYLQERLERVYENDSFCIGNELRHHKNNQNAPAVNVWLYTTYGSCVLSS